MDTQKHAQAVGSIVTGFAIGAVSGYLIGTYRTAAIANKQQVEQQAEGMRRIQTQMKKAHRKRKRERRQPIHFEGDN